MRQAQFTSGFVVHAVLALLLVCFLRLPETLAPHAVVPDETLVWTAAAGGGRGGDGTKAAPAQRPKQRRADQQFTIPSTSVVSSILELPGVVAVVAAADAPGPGTDDGRGKGRARGDGPGSGTEGPGPGSGEGPWPPGTPGVVGPEVIFEKKPEYTADALRMNLHGSVLLEAVVLPDGSVGAVRIVRSLDDRFGLDQKAIEAVRLWKFRPATRFGKAVAVPVLIELTFTVR